MMLKGLKKIALVLGFICLLSNALMAQSWLWGAAGRSRHFYYAEVSLDHAAAVDGSGNVAYTGYFDDTVNFGPYALVSTSSFYDAYTVKYDANGNVLWAKQAALASRHCTAQGYTSVCDAADNTYITGYFIDTVTFGSVMLTNAYGGGAMYLVKYDPAGNAVWGKQSTQSVSNASAGGNSVAMDGLGNLYVTGTFMDTVMFGPYTVRSYETYKSNLFTAKFDAGGNVLWVKPGIAHSSYFGAFACSIVTDKLGGVYSAGYFTDTLIVGPDTLLSPGAESVFLVKYDTGGNFKWATQSYNNSRYSRGLGLSVSVDGLNHIYMIGGIVDTVNFGTHALYAVPHKSNVFLVRFDTAGNVVWAEAGNEIDSNGWFGYSVMCDTLKKGGGYGLMYGSGHSPFNMALGYDTVRLRTSYNTVATLFQFDTNGRVECSSIISEGDIGNGGGVAVNKAGSNIYMTGDFTDTLTFGHTTISADNSGNASLIARWKTCCAQITTSMSTVDATCHLPNGSVMVNAGGGTGPLSYTWSPDVSGADSAGGLDAGIYSITVSDSLDCTKTIDATIVNRGGITAGACCNTSIISGSFAELLSNQASKYLWTPNLSLSCDTCQSVAVSPTVTTLYYLTVYDTIGCSAKDSILVTVEENCGTVFIPDAFSPNGDGQNDMLVIKGKCINSIDFKIYDRWANNVFESENINTGWDGTYKGKPMNTGTYIYVLNATLNDGTAINKKGNITLVR